MSQRRHYHCHNKQPKSQSKPHYHGHDHDKYGHINYYVPQSYPKDTYLGCPMHLQTDLFIHHRVEKSHVERGTNRCYLRKH